MLSARTWLAACGCEPGKSCGIFVKVPALGVGLQHLV